MTTLGCLDCKHLWDNCTCDDKDTIGHDRDMFEGDILPRVQMHIARNEFSCEAKCGYKIQKEGRYWTVTSKGGVNPTHLCFKCKEANRI